MRTAWIGIGVSLCSMLVTTAVRAIGSEALQPSPLAETGRIERLWATTWSFAAEAAPAAGHRVETWLDQTSKPVIASVASAIARIKVKRPRRHLMTQQQIDEVVQRLQPGDLVLERTDGYLSNALIDGFWGHVILNLGSFDETARYFDTVEIRDHLAGLGYRDFVEYAIARQPAAVAAWRADGPQHPIRMIEADGVVGRVVLYSAEEALASDNVAVLRPHALSRLEKMLALVAALAYLGTPYDLDFDTRTDDAVVCTELVARAYATGEHQRGLRFDVDMLAGGRTMIYPNRIAEMYQRERGQADRQLDFVYFVTADEDNDRAVASDESAFSTSHAWQRLL
ncbi:MAG: hypothetical protein JXR83_07050 [Deltaproteobacteria bacterium]|nr:hypothetical protein [Deltaproteobacteria bacterium]